MDSAANPEYKTVKVKAFTFDPSSSGCYKDEMQEVKVKIKSKETTEKYKSLHLSPFFSE